jgi:GNAT superfamily N-acetyltransferase/acyl carrier protein
MTSPLAINLRTILRRHALIQGDRQIATNLPLGATGLGLDSLALLQFITAVENQYEIELPETIWTEKGELTIERFESLVLEQRPELARASIEQQIALSADSRQSTHSEREHHFYELPKASLATRLWRKIRHEERFLILEHNLKEGDFPRHSAIIPVEIRTATADDILQSGSIFPESSRSEKLAAYRRRLVKDVTAFVALLGDKIVGIDWLNGIGSYESGLGLEVKMKPGSCFGYDLNEHPDYRGKGVGMALLSHSLESARRANYASQFTIVHASNTKMLSAAVQIFGFEVVGEIVTKRWFGRRWCTWKLGDRVGRGLIEL